MKSFLRADQKFIIQILSDSICSTSRPFIPPDFADLDSVTEASPWGVGRDSMDQQAMHVQSPSRRCEAGLQALTTV
jgi:hypothetical protein